MNTLEPAVPADARPGGQRPAWPWYTASGVLFLVGLVIVCMGGMWLTDASVTENLLLIFWRLRVVVLLLLEQSLLVLPWMASAMGFGWGLRRLAIRGGFNWPVGLSGQLALGAGLFCLVSWLVALGTTHPAGSWAVAVVGWVLVIWQVHISDIGRWARPSAWAPPGWPIVIGSIAAGILIGCTTLAPLGLWDSQFNGYMALLHHLQVAREWAWLGRMTGLEHNAYSYLPNLFEIAYMQMGLWRGDFHESAYGDQLLHALFAVVTALQLRRIVIRLGGTPTAGAATAAIYIVTPWTLITGSLAYTDQAAMALGATALSLILPDPAGSTGGATTTHDVTRTALTGLALGLAMLCRIESACMIALPILVATAVSGPGGMRRAGLTAVAAVVVLSPWFIRNIFWTSNPTFPYLAEVLSSAHWSADQAARWSAVHASRGIDLNESLRLLFVDQGFGFLILPAGLVAAATLWVLRAADRGIVIGLLIVCGLPVVIWALFMPADGRLILPVLLPMITLIGLAMTAISKWRAGHSLGIALATALIVAGTLVQSTMYINERNGRAPTYIERIKTLVNLDKDEIDPNIYNLFNELRAQDPDARIYTEAVVGPFYFKDDDSFEYHTRFDTSPIGPTIHARGGAGARSWLLDNGYTNVVIDNFWLDRWRGEQFPSGVAGYDPNIDEQTMRELRSVLRRITSSPWQTIYAVAPRE